MVHVPTGASESEEGTKSDQGSFAYEAVVMTAIYDK